MTIKENILFIPLLLLTVLTAWSQPVPASLPVQGTTITGNQCFATVAPHGILFQEERNGTTNLYLLHPGNDTVEIRTPPGTAVQHPVWVPGKNAIVFDTGTGKNSRLVYLDRRKKQLKTLINRNIACREASFTPSRHLVVFSGFDDRTQRWQIFSYDFIYDNLNRLTTENGTCRFPVFSPDGKNIIYTFRDENGNTFLKSINWYGGHAITLANHVTRKACWTAGSWRILYVRHWANRYLLNSVRRDGSNTNVLLSAPYPLCCPAAGQKGTIWLSVKPEGAFYLKKIKQPMLPEERR